MSERAARQRRRLPHPRSSCAIRRPRAARHSPVRGLARKHDWQITPRLSFKVDVNVITDDLVFREYGDRLGERARSAWRRTCSSASAGIRWNLVANVLWYQDLTTPAADRAAAGARDQALRRAAAHPGAAGLPVRDGGVPHELLRDVGDSGLRIDLHPRVYYPIPIAGLFTVTPFAGGRLTYYNQHVVGTRVTQLRGDRRGHDGRAARAPPGRGRRRGRDPRLARLRHGRLGRPRRAPARHRAARHVPHDPGLRSEGQSPVRSAPSTASAASRRSSTRSPIGSMPRRWRPRMPRRCGGRRCASRSRRSTTSTGRSRTDSPSRTCRASSSSTRAPSCASAARPPTTCTARGSASANTDLTARYRDVAVTVGSRYDAVAGANWVVGEVTARILANVDAPREHQLGRRGRNARGGPRGVDVRFQCWAVMAEYVYRRNNESRVPVRHQPPRRRSVRHQRRGRVRPVIPQIDLVRQHAALADELLAATARVLAAAASSSAPRCRRSRRSWPPGGARHGVGLDSGTDALLLALKAVGVGPGDEVITSAFSFVASASTVVMVGAVPVFVDIDPETYNLDPRRLEAAVTPRTRAVVPVHLYGQPAAMDAIEAIARRRGLAVVDDAAQAVGASYDGRPIGRVGRRGMPVVLPDEEPRRLRRRRHGADDARRRRRARAPAARPRRRAEVRARRARLLAAGSTSCRRRCCA